jgi:KUP system potassium uptake protein
MAMRSSPRGSVLSAVEGLTVVHPAFAEVVLPISIAILIGLFAIQSRGTAAVGKLFGPVMLVYFVVIALLGIRGIAHAQNPAGGQPVVCAQVLPLDPMLAFLALGSVVLAVTAPRRSMPIWATSAAARSWSPGCGWPSRAC